MITTNNTMASIYSPVRTIGAKVELYSGSTLVSTFEYTDALKSVTIDRVGDDSKFFGFGICHRASIRLIDLDRAINITTSNTLRVYFKTDGDYVSTFPTFHVTQAPRNENTNEITITAYDAIYKTDEHTVAELSLPTGGYNIAAVALSCAQFMNGNMSFLAFKGLESTDSAFLTNYPTGANFGGDETIRSVLNAIAEATQTIYYFNANDYLVFCRLDEISTAATSVDNKHYITLETNDNRRLAEIWHVTELGDNVYNYGSNASVTGSTQYVRDNPFWNMRDDVDILVDEALERIGGLTIGQFDCHWRGDFRLEIGDKIWFFTKDNKDLIISYLLNDTITYDGSYSQHTQWKYVDNEDETAGNPTSLGEVLKQTYARVDKANNEITLVAGKYTDLDNKVGSLNDDTNNRIEDINAKYEEVSSQVALAITTDELKIEVQKELSNGVDKVTTSTGFVFDDDGLSISKTDAEMKTQITEDGMTVHKNNDEVLTANNEGVKAVNLHAVTYLIIGNNSRLEDYGTNRTACFWIG